MFKGYVPVLSNVWVTAAGSWNISQSRQVCGGVQSSTCGCQRIS